VGLLAAASALLWQADEQPYLHLLAISTALLAGFWALGAYMQRRLGGALVLAIDVAAAVNRLRFDLSALLTGSCRRPPHTASTQRRRMVGMVIAAHVDHQGMAATSASVLMRGASTGYSALPAAFT
jgi:hypothetical protein